MDPALTPRVATFDDLDAVTKTITLAFAQDPIWAVAFSRPDGRVDHQRLLFGVWLEGAMRYPWIWRTHDGAAVTVWIPPGGTDLSSEQEERFDALATEHIGDRADLLRELLGRFDAAHPRTELHYYLSLFGTHPAYRGRGIGMALLADNLARIDVEGKAAYLESTNPANNQRYQRVGFTRIGEFASPFDGRIITTMWRQPIRTAPA